MVASLGIPVESFVLTMLTLLIYFSLSSGCKSKYVFEFSIFNKQGCCTGEEFMYETSTESLQSMYSKFSGV